MDFFHGAVALLSFVLMILAGLVAWLYMQQTRLLQAVNALAIAVATPPQSYEPSYQPEPVQEEATAAVEDDRVSVYEQEEELEEGEIKEDIPKESVPKEEHIDEDTDFAKKTVAELRTLLTNKGIPFNKSDKKPTLISLLQATA